MKKLTASQRNFLANIEIPKGLNAKRIEQFIDIYEICGEQSCKNAFGSHYGQDGKYYFAQFMCMLESKKAAAAKKAEVIKVAPLTQSPFMWKVAKAA